jgi:CRP-like cAMP-binding protein
VLVAHNNRVSFNSNQNQLLGRLAPKQLEQLLPHLEAIDAPQRQVLQRRGERVDFVHFPETAVVSFVVALEDGHTVEVGMVGREGLVGIGVLLKDEIAVHDAMVQIAGKVLRISRQKFREAIESDPALQAQLLSYIHAFHFQIAQTAACNASHDLEQRCARWLLTARDRAGSDEFSVTHEFLAMMLAVRRSGVTVAAGLFERAGFIKNRRGRVTILDPESLEEISCECHRLIREEEARLLS